MACQGSAARVELVIAEGHGIEGKKGIESFLKGKTQDTVKKASLHLIACVQCEYMGIAFPGGFYGSRKARSSASRSFLIVDSVAIPVCACRVGMGVVHMGYHKLEVPGLTDWRAGKKCKESHAKQRIRFHPSP